ncbi:hypothetical protein PRK78_004722 [Emydomyces testavorans]|uniref:YeeE/YedE family integral membrane protein n=1 Tax=Emydomyces testavorans TaxID=2070801 RepID=A0AAF0DJ18_9EURO|nr:hypothetical protein PRK78_004722 [Emydomyces testavorans]
MFTPVETSLGALLLYQGASGLLQHTGRVLGVSGLLSGCMGRPGLENTPIVLGLASSIIPVYLLAPSLLPSFPPPPASLAAVLWTVGTGFLVGWGTKNANGCTSGHMLCGLSRLSPRSMIATGIFFATALVTANSEIGTPIPSCGDQPCYTPSYPSTYELGFMCTAIALAQLANSILVPRFLHRDEQSAVLYSYIAGMQFGLGLSISGMANPAKILGFFSVRDLSRFDPSLGLVMLFGVMPNLWSYFRMKREFGNEEGKKPPTLTARFQLPTKTVKDIDWRFVLGAMAFGVGWGLCGVCPGPGLLRALLQPAWGAVWLGGFWLGSSLGL